MRLITDDHIVITLLPDRKGSTVMFDEGTCKARFQKCLMDTRWRFLRLLAQPVAGKRTSWKDSRSLRYRSSSS